jgi:hypothetical protein
MILRAIVLLLVVLSSRISRGDDSKQTKPVKEFLTSEVKFDAGENKWVKPNSVRHADCCEVARVF